MLCPFCTRPVLPDAIECPLCGEELRPPDERQHPRHMPSPGTAPLPCPAKHPVAAPTAEETYPTAPTPPEPSSQPLGPAPSSLAGPLTHQDSESLVYTTSSFTRLPALERSSAWRVRAILAAGAVLIVAAAAIAYLAVMHRTSTSTSASTTTRHSTAGTITGAALNTPTDTTSPSTPATSGPTAIASTLDAMLNDSQQARGIVAAAAQQLQNCAIQPSEAATDFTRAAAIRQDLLNRINAVETQYTPLSPPWDQLTQLFGTMQSNSLQADQAFTAWAQDVQSLGCTSTAAHTANYDQANQWSGQATVNKRQFLTLWNSTATEFGLVTRNEGQI
jgi:hypothetical protein